MLEGVAFGARAMMDAALAAGATVTGQLVVVGGATRSPTFMQLYADVLGRPLVIPVCAEATLTGAAIVAVAGHRYAGGDRAAGAGGLAELGTLLADTSTAWFEAAAVYEPDLAAHAAYAAPYGQYLATYHRLRDGMHATAAAAAERV
jgi:sugar (pentulose or hexulose) kinase